MQHNARGRTALDERPLVAIIGTGGRAYREYLLDSISSRYRIHLIEDAEPTWESRYLAGSSIVDMSETVDADEMIAAVRRVADSEPVQGVLAWDEARVLQCAKVAAALHLPGGDPQVAMRCRDKYLTREALQIAQVPQPQSILATGLDEARAAADKIGYPVVLKPRAMAASLGVVLVASPDELADALVFARDTTIPGAWHYEEVLVEEYAPGPEISVDSAVHAGEVFPMFIARKHVGFAPYFEETGHVVDSADPLLTDPMIARVIADIHAALGFTDGMTHTELKLGPDGPKVIEINARLGGGLIPYLGMRATGIDPGLAAAAVACGQRPDLVSSRRLIAAVRFFYVAHDDTRIESIELSDEQLPDAVDLLVALAKAGDVMSPPPKGTAFGRIGFATAVAESAEQCEQALDAAQRALVVSPDGACPPGTGLQ
ncbi:MAG: ATP-grasp domain-containing protein [Actinomycetota bacterium]|nr:ATP-grasp domain-containing protein [Actinomycetota bacterium]MDQ2955733.1 ATP-grasp domain-containing protein [Actinomycetota bacterium]